MIGPIFDFLAKLAMGIGSYLSQYGSNKNQEARRMQNEQERHDQFNKAIKERDIESVRRGLSGRP